MKQPMDQDLKTLMDEQSIKTTVISYLMTLVFAAVSAVAAMGGREMIERLMRAFIIKNASELQVSQGTGLSHLSTITGLVLMVSIWLGAFMVVWSRTEKAGTLKKRVKVNAIWIGGAACCFLVFLLVTYFVTGQWLTLRGGV
jgi:small-conductance mechanosensitive channel